MNKKQKDKFINLILILILFMLIISNIILVLKISKKDEDNTNKVVIENNVEEDKKEDKEETEDYVEVDITEMSEYDRMRRYINEFLDEVERKNYKKAYSLLNQDFKDNYFKTESDFKQYAENYLKLTTSSIEYENIERLGNPVNGNIYVVFVKFIDVFGNQNIEEIEESKFVILEKDYDKFELSFNVKS